MVLGAGLSGLYSSFLLEKQGFDVSVLEARRQVGGRVHTLDDLAGTPESGGQNFSEQYHRLLKITKLLDLPVKPETKPSKQQLLSIGQKLILSNNWKTSSANQLSPEEKSLIPMALMNHYLQQFSVG